MARMQQCQSKARATLLGICAARKFVRAAENLLMRTISGRIDGEPSTIYMERDKSPTPGKEKFFVFGMCRVYHTLYSLHAAQTKGGASLRPAAAAAGARRITAGASQRRLRPAAAAAGARRITAGASRRRGGENPTIRVFAVRKAVWVGGWFQRVGSMAASWPLQMLRVTLHPFQELRADAVADCSGAAARYAPEHHLATLKRVELCLRVVGTQRAHDVFLNEIQKRALQRCLVDIPPLRNNGVAIGAQVTAGNPARPVQFKIKEGN